MDEKLQPDLDENSIEFLAKTAKEEDIYICPKCGYECTGYSMAIRINKDENGKPYESDICACCYIKWLGATFPRMVKKE